MKLLFLLCFLLLTGCTNQRTLHPDDEVGENKDNVQGRKSTNSGDGETGSTAEPEEDEATDNLPLKAFFMEDGTVAHFKGDGYEFATYTIRTQFLDDNYVNEYQSSGGTVMVRTYRIEEDQVLLLRAEGESHEEYNPGKLELESLEPISVYLRYPLEKGVEFNNWVVIDTEASLSTPYKNFENVIFLEHMGEDRTLYRKYLAKGFGTIKYEIIMPSDATEPNMSSILEKIE